MRIAIYGSRRQQTSAAQIKAFLLELNRRGAGIVMHRNLYSHLYELIPEALSTVGTVVDGTDFNADLAFSFGGDGTFLRAAVWVGDKQIPIVGVNTGHLGFLTALSIERLPHFLNDFAADSFRIEPRRLLEVKTPYLGARALPYALNEVVVAKSETGSMIEALVSINETPLANYRADGIIVCTATGSTAYNLSVGGPIVQPTLDVNVISPVAAHSLSMRPLVVDGTANVNIVPGGRSGHVRLSLDGRNYEIERGTNVEICPAPFHVLLLQPSDRTFADSLRDKLHWGEN